jgi:hypothetical protein
MRRIFSLRNFANIKLKKSGLEVTASKIEERSCSHHFAMERAARVASAKWKPSVRGRQRGEAEEGRKMMLCRNCIDPQDCAFHGCYRGKKQWEIRCDRQTYLRSWIVYAIILASRLWQDISPFA